MPKAGSHLLQKAVAGLLGVANPGIALIPNSFRAEIEAYDGKQAVVPLGIGRFIAVPQDAVRRAMQRVMPGEFTLGHVPYTSEMEGLLTELDWRVVTILRDPRDVVVSHAHYLGSKPDNHFHPLPPSERIRHSIAGIESGDPRPIHLLGIDARYRRILGWQDSPLNLTTRFEALIGSRGGGSDEQQRAELLRIAHHLGLSPSAEEIERVVSVIFGNTYSFRKGTIGQWRDEFDPTHRESFKQAAGSLLIELGYEKTADW